MANVQALYNAIMLPVQHHMHLRLVSNLPIAPHSKFTQQCVLPGHVVVSIAVGRPELSIVSCITDQQGVSTIVVENTSDGPLLSDVFVTGAKVDTGDFVEKAAIPSDANAAKYLFAAIAHAEDRLGVPHGTAYADPDPPSDNEMRFRANRGSSVPWLIACAIRDRPVLMRLQVTRTGDHLLVTILDQATKKTIGKEVRSQNFEMTAITQVLMDLHVTGSLPQE